MTSAPVSTLPASAFNKVAEVTLYFWIAKVLATTVGETGADYLIFSMKLGLPRTSVIMGAVLLVVLGLQVASRVYRPWLYWLSVVMVSIVGTLVTDSLVDTYGVKLETTTLVFSAVLAATFGLWYARERTLSVKTITTVPRELFYWLAILLTFALGTAAGDLVSERWNLGYLVSGAIFAGMILAVVLARRFFGLSAVTAFWIAYVLTRPLGASAGDFLTQPPAQGGLGFGTTETSLVFAAVILGLVMFSPLRNRPSSLPVLAQGT